MEPHELAIAAKYIGAGLAAIGTGAAGIGVGTLFGQFLNGALRNPSAVEGQFGRLIFGFAVTEALGIFALLLAFLLMFAVCRERDPTQTRSRPSGRSAPHFFDIEATEPRWPTLPNLRPLRPKSATS